MRSDPAEAPACLALVGPTASGKTALSLALAEAIGGEVVSMDSRQVYRGMDIGTAKATPADRARVPHHGLDLVEPGERYSAGRFGRDARGRIAAIRGRDRVPILVGGTGFFLRAILEPIFAEPELDAVRVERLRAWLRRLPRERLADGVRALDPARAALAEQGGPQRMSRTLEVALLSGRPLSEWHRTAPADGAPVRGVVVRLDLPREEMDRRIDARVGRMVEAGLVGEVRGLLERGVSSAAPGMTATGYREIVAHLRGERTLEEAVDDIRSGTRRYARRQLTWLRNQLPEGTRVVDATASLEEQVRDTVRAWREAGGGGPWDRLQTEVNG
ncbi:MAG TPA: tRNA (adenosine(37)-N6)-dimethylallyltransferase MiaA [Longimicrobiales bacterium]|nr:tRNA (adenosine(37)-N6)-dimethylallyltransferase MiaA [Longimicrobiales bacterium]